MNVKTSSLDLKSRSADDRCMTSTSHLTVRHATAADAAALRDLVLLDSARPLTGPVLLAELDGTPVAARSLADGRFVADPMVPTAAALDVLRAYAARLEPASAAHRAPWGLRLLPGAAPARGVV